MNKIIFEKVGQRLKQAREFKHITLEEAGRKVDVHKSTVLRWENGETEKIKLPVIEALANLYEVNPVWLMGYDVDMQIKNNTTSGISNCNDYSIPIFDIIHRTDNGFLQDNIIGYISLDNISYDANEYFALKINDDSMQPLLHDGDIVVVHKQNDVEDGEFAVVLVDDEVASVRKVTRCNNSVDLMAFNSYYPTRHVDESHVFIIIGKVVEGRISQIFNV